MALASPPGGIAIPMRTGNIRSAVVITFRAGCRACEFLVYSHRNLPSSRRVVQCRRRGSSGARLSTRTGATTRAIWIAEPMHIAKTIIVPTPRCSAALADRLCATRIRSSSLPDPAISFANSRYFRPVSPKESRIHKWDQEFESAFLQQRVCEPSVPQRRKSSRSKVEDIDGICPF